MTVEEFLATDQHAFGLAWRYELVDGRPVARATPAPEHGAIMINLSAALKRRLKGNPCRPEMPRRWCRTTRTVIAPAFPTC